MLSVTRPQFSSKTYCGSCSMRLKRVSGWWWNGIGNSIGKWPICLVTRLTPWVHIWTLMCTYIAKCQTIKLFHSLQKFELSIPIRTFKFPFVVNAFWQTLQTNGRSPVWVRMWIWTAELELKFLWQTRHKCFKFVDCGFSFDGLLDGDEEADGSSEYDVLFDWVGELGGNDLLASDFLEWNRGLGMVSGNGIVDLSCDEPASLN